VSKHHVLRSGAELSTARTKRCGIPTRNLTSMKLRTAFRPGGAHEPRMVSRRMVFGPVATYDCDCNSLNWGLVSVDLKGRLRPVRQLLMLGLYMLMRVANRPCHRRRSCLCGSYPGMWKHDRHDLAGKKSPLVCCKPSASH